MSVLLGTEYGNVRWDFPPCLSNSAYQQALVQALSEPKVTVGLERGGAGQAAVQIVVAPMETVPPGGARSSGDSCCASGHSLGYTAVVEWVSGEGGRKRRWDDEVQLAVRWTTAEDRHDCAKVVGWLALDEAVQRALKTTSASSSRVRVNCVHVLASSHAGAADAPVSSAVLEVLGELPTDAAPDERALFVARLASTTTADDLEIIFSRFGEVERVSLVKDADGTPRGYGFVHFTSKADAEAAYVGMHDAVVDGKRIVVDFSQSHRGRRPPTTGRPALR